MNNVYAVASVFLVLVGSVQTYTDITSPAPAQAETVDECIAKGGSERKCLLK